MTISFDGKTISINAEWLAERIAKGEMDARQLWNLMHHELLHLTEMRLRRIKMRVRRIEVKPDEEIAELYFDAVDLKKTIDGYDADNYPDDMRLRDIPKCQENLDAMTTLGDLVDDILHIAETLDDRCNREEV